MKYVIVTDALKEVKDPTKYGFVDMAINLMPSGLIQVRLKIGRK